MFLSIKKGVVATLLASPFVLFSAAIGAADSVSPDSNMNDDDWSPIMTAAELEAAVDVMPELQIIDIRAEKYAKNDTIPGAVWLPYSGWRGPRERPGQPPTEAELAEMMGQAGINLEDPIVIFNHSGKTMQTGQAAYVYWLIKSAGSDEVAIMTGGFKSWDAIELPTAQDHLVREPGMIDVSYRYDWWSDPMDIFAVVSGQKDGTILDARFDNHVKRAIETGKPLTSMPLARYVPVGLLATNLTDRSMSQEQMDAYRTDLEARGIELDGDLLISICQTGELSALSWFYASEIVGIENVQYYPDALQGWIADGGTVYGLRVDS